MRRFFGKKKQRNKGFIEIYGFHSVKAALKNPKRKHVKLVIANSQKDFITREIQESVREIIELPNKEMFRLYGAETTHQGIVLTTTNLIQPNLDEILDQSHNNEVEIVIINLGRILDRL